MAMTYYIWKWADNDLAGPPQEIVRQLDREEMPAALQPFSPGAAIDHVLDALNAVMAQARGSSKWHIEVVSDQQEQARALWVRDPAGLPGLSAKLLGAVWKAELTLYNATTNRLIGLPKRNVVECPSSRQLVDITAADLPVLLHELSAQEDLAALTCYDRHGDMLQVWCHNRRLAVEWQILPERDFNRHRIWVASRPVRARGRTRLGTVETGLNLFTDEVLSPRDVHRLWIAFLHGNERPNAYHWREVTQELDMPGLPPRHRHTSAADQTRQPCFGSS